MNGKDRTINDFGEQWLQYSDNEGYYGSLELFSKKILEFKKTKNPLLVEGFGDIKYHL